jgi:hypothetical protein
MSSQVEKSAQYSGWAETEAPVAIRASNSAESGLALIALRRCVAMLFSM